MHITHLYCNAMKVDAINLIVSAYLFELNLFEAN